MTHILMTGATGLVGQYVLRDLLSRGQRVAVLTRSSKLQTARQRIESVMTRWERLAGHSLCRPVVLEGNLCDEHLGMEPSARRWVANNCRAVLHSAASMMFREDKHGEPHRTNVEGMRRLLDLCREAKLRQFHHVSTAYICGLREGRILESEVDLDQTLGNVYEESKLAAEKMVRATDFLDQLTIYRPASVVGDSQNGYCTSLHGFYLPLQLAYTFANKVSPQFMNERSFFRLGLEGEEGKNFVPVDWLSASIAHLVTQPQHHGRTYHLASPNPVTVRLFQEVVQQAISMYSDRRPATQLNDEQLVGLEQLFHDQMLIYRSHWRNDPTFDLTNTRNALPNLPCPEMDRELLLRVARYPIEKKFAVDRYEPAVIRFDTHQHLESWIQEDPLEGDSGPPAETVALQINGSGGGQWSLSVRDGRVLHATPGVKSQETAEIYLNTDTFALLVAQELSVEESVNSGRLVIQNTNGDYRHCVEILEQLSLFRNRL